MGRGKPRHIPPVKDTVAASKLAGYHVQRIASSSANCSFSLKYLNLTDTDFIVKHNDAAYYHKIIERLQALSTTSVLDLMENRSSALRCHPIKWDDAGVSRNCFGIPHEDQLCEKPYQITISSNKYGRLHGFFTGDIFNIVWFDKNHALYTNSAKP